MFLVRVRSCIVFVVVLASLLWLLTEILIKEPRDFRKSFAMSYFRPEVSYESMFIPTYERYPS